MATLSAASGRSHSCPFAGAAASSSSPRRSVGWNCGNVGPVVGSLTREFDIGLGEVGLLSGAFFFAGSALGSLAGAALARKIRVLVGNLGMLRALGRGEPRSSRPATASASSRPAESSPGLPSGSAAVFIPAYARAIGGVKMVGLFGAGLTLGVAAALFLGSVLEGADVSWRVAFLITAALAAIALPILPNERVEIPRTASEGEGLARECLTNQAWWRVQLLGLTTLTIPLVVGAWLVHFLIIGYGMSAAEAGGARLRAVRDLGGDARHRGPDDRLRSQSLAAGDRGPRPSGRAGSSCSARGTPPASRWSPWS